jgi:uncharacterized membrane protein YeiB
MKTRIIGYDFARAFAIFGMVFVNFKIVLDSTTGNETLRFIVSLLEGRASALFVVLAGVGISLLTKTARLQRDASVITHKRLLLLKRGLLLIFIGLLYTPIWPADILHFYGFYFLIAAYFITVSDRMLWGASAVSCLAFVLLLFIFDYETGWDFSTLTYLDFWTFAGMFRHIFFNGFHPVIPWLAFIFMGMWLGRQDLSNLARRRKIALASGSIWVLTELASKSAIILVSQYLSHSHSYDDIISLLGTSIMPPMPQYIIAASSFAVLIVCFSIEVTEKYPTNPINTWLAHTGQLSLTLYVAHVIIGMGLLEALGLLNKQPVEIAIISAGLFCIVSIVFSHWWVNRYKEGPLERLFRKISDQ